jgi:ribosomal protein S12 methylthiotransferase
MNERNVHVVSLGCPKNLVDSEVMAAILADHGYRLTPGPEEARILLVNTCAFILPAREESIEEILRLAAWKKGGTGPCTHLVVTGCLPQRYGRELAEALPEVDLFLGISEIPRIGHHLDALLGAPAKARQRRLIAGKPTFLMNAGHRRLLAAPTHSAYLKIADGCSNRCAYCLIPAIRGRARSRPIDDLVKEAATLAGQGVREVIITAQDSTAYGLDLKGKPTLSRLLKELCGIDGIAWIRLLYTHPARMTEELLETMAGEEKICHYLDIPIQHSDDTVLKAMGRRGDNAQIRRVIAQARSLLPCIALRTSLIVGFPRETSRRFENLLAFIREIRFDHLGVFAYSREEGTAAAELPSRISEKEKERRRSMIMEEQGIISREINAALIGSCQEVLIDGAGELEGYPLLGRCRRQSPEIDGVTHVRGTEAEPGTIIPCRIVAADDYDIFAEPL